MKQYDTIKQTYNQICKEYEAGRAKEENVECLIRDMIVSIDPSMKKSNELSKLVQQAIATLKKENFLIKDMKQREFGKFENKFYKITQTLPGAKISKSTKLLKTSAVSIVNAFQNICHEIAMFFRKVMKKPTLADQIEKAVEKLVRDAHPTLATRVKTAFTGAKNAVKSAASNKKGLVVATGVRIAVTCRKPTFKGQSSPSLPIA